MYVCMYVYIYIYIYTYIYIYIYIYIYSSPRHLDFSAEAVADAARACRNSLRHGRLVPPDVVFSMQGRRVPHVAAQLLMGLKNR